MRKPPRLEIKADDAYELESFIDPFLGLRLENHMYLSESWEGRSKNESKEFNEFLKLELLGKGYYASVYKVYHRPSKKLMV